MTITRNAPCHCGSGKKYKYCCLKKDQRHRYEQIPVKIDDFISTSQIRDCGEPQLDDEFFGENPTEALSAAAMLYQELTSRQIESVMEEVAEELGLQSEHEKKRIEETDDIEGLIAIMEQNPAPINHRLLKAKIVQQSELAIPMIIDELENTPDDMFVELGVKILYESKTDCSSQVLELVRRPIKRAYTLSLLCLLLGMIGCKDATKPLWDTYHYLKIRYPNKSYKQGPLIGLYKLYTQKV